MKEIKHRKYRNTGLIFEMLTRQITADVLNEREESPAIDIVKEHFNGENELSKELNLYRVLMEETFPEEDKAKDFLEEVVETRKRLNFDKLHEQKYEVIGDIKKHYPLKEFFKSRVDNYRELASVYKVFKAMTEDEGVEYDPSDVVRSKYTIVEHVTGSSVDRKEDEIEAKVRERLKEQSSDLRLLTQRVMIEKFNEKYGSLLPEQKQLLRKYINNVSNTNDLREFVNDKTEEVREDIGQLIDEVDEKVVKIKVNEALNLLNEIDGKNGIVRDDEISNLMMYYQLREDIENALKKQK